MNSITLRRNTVGQFAQQNILIRLLYWLAMVPFRILGFLVVTLHRVLSYVLPSPRMALRVLWYQVVALSLVMNVFLAHQHYVLRCAFNYKVQGWFMTKEQCGDLESSWMDAAELARQAEVQAESNGTQ